MARKCFDFTFKDNHGCDHDISVCFKPGDLAGADPDDILDHVKDEVQAGIEGVMDDATPQAEDMEEALGYDAADIERKIKKWMTKDGIPFGAPGSSARPKPRAKKKARKKKKVFTRKIVAVKKKGWSAERDDEPPEQPDQPDERKRTIDFFKGRREPRGPSGGLLGVPRSLMRRRR